MGCGTCYFLNLVKDCDSETLCRILSVLGSSSPTLPSTVVSMLIGMYYLHLLKPSVLFLNSLMSRWVTVWKYPVLYALKVTEAKALV